MTSGPRSLLLVGCGRMGSALLGGWARDLNMDMVAVDPCPPKDLPQGVTWVESLDKAAGRFDVVVLAVKPQMMGGLLEAGHPRSGEILREATLLLSIAAGKTLGYFQEKLGKAPVVRVMPNTPALVGESISALYANAEVDAKGRAWAEALMGAVGEVVWLEEEEQMDAFTAVAGSGPAYVFHLIEALAQAARNAGLPDRVAGNVARQTVIGSALLAKASADTPARLRENVTSPGGTTEAALKVLMPELPKLMTKAVQAAVKRAKEL